MWPAMTSRAATHTKSSIEAVESELRGLADQLSTIREAMNTFQLDEIVVASGHKEMQRALTGFRSFASNLPKALSEARRVRGDFGAPEAAGKPPEKKRRSKKG